MKTSIVGLSIVLVHLGCPPTSAVRCRDVWGHLQERGGREICGAVTGAFMVLGLAYCDEGCRAVNGRKQVYERVVSFAREFRARHGTLTCRDLLGCDISTPEGSRMATEKGLFQSKCPEFVRTAAELLEASLPSAPEVGTGAAGT